MKNSKKSVIVSAITIIALCFSIMVGGTYAWFTSHVTKNVNKINAGTLKVELNMRNNPDDEWENAEGKTLDFLRINADGKLEVPTDDIWWEPGCTYKLPEIQVVNTGNLAFNYVVKLSGAIGNKELLDAIVFSATVDGEKVLLKNGDVICKDSILPNKERNSTGAVIALKAHMLETADNRYQGMSLDGLTVTVDASQKAYEIDSEGSDYDGQLSEFTFRDGIVASVTNDASADGGYGVIYADSGAQVTVDANITAEESFDNYAMAVWAKGEGTKVVINGGDFTQKITGNDNQYDLIYANEGAQIEINGGTFKVGAGDPKWTLNCKDGSGSVITVKGGKFYKFDPSAPRKNQADEIVVPEDYTVVQVGDWYEVVKKDGATVTVSDDLDLTASIDVKGSTLTLDATGKTITNTTDLWDNNEGVKVWSLVSAKEGANLTIVDGSFVAKANDCYAADVRDGSDLVIKAGTFIGNIHAVYVEKGTLTIEGGFFSVQQKYPDANKADGFVLNCYDANRADGTAKIIVTGGTFVNFNPADCWAEGAHTNFVAEGYTVTSVTQANGDVWYTVVKA